jgi:hypothetical protein
LKIGARGCTLDFISDTRVHAAHHGELKQVVRPALAGDL